MFNVRKFVAFDMSIHGPAFIIPEFAIGFLGIVALGVFVLVRGNPLLGAYFISIGCNYLPLFAYSIMLRTKEAALAEAAQIRATGILTAKYSLWQFAILVPFFVVLLSIYQVLRGTTRA